MRAGRGNAELDAGPTQQRAVLAVLLLRNGTATSVDGLIDALWGEDVPDSAASTVRTYISRLRRALEDGAPGSVIRSVPGGYQVDLAPRQLDLTVFRRHMTEAEGARQAGDLSLAAEHLTHGLGLWHGAPLAGLPGPFAARQRAKLERLRAFAEAARLRAELDLGGPDRVLPEIAELAAEHPLDERLRETLITALYRAGRQAEALATYEETRSLLAKELGIDPGPALRSLHERILRADPTLMPATAVSPGDEPPAALGSGDPCHPRTEISALADEHPLGNLPQQFSSFVGRDRELAEVRALVARARLVTLTGTGGAGKTRLALQVAAGLLDDTGNEVWFADLGPVRDPELVAVTVADLLGVRRDPGQPVTGALVGTIGERRLLVLLDNCEHVAGACAKLSDALLRGCPNLTLLSTSREPLGIGGEQIYRVPSLGVPAEGAGTAAIQVSEAVRLLADRAAAQGAPLAWDEELTWVAGRICQRLDGIPLAIELAAARLRTMPAAELENRLDQRFALLTGGSRVALPRQQTLRATVDWSWELLTGDERLLLACLSTFAGGFSLPAAEAVAAGAGIPALDVLGHLGGLVDKSLVQFGDTAAGPGRYRLLETIRQYAADRLDALGTATASAGNASAATATAATASAARAAHRDYYLALAELAVSHLKTVQQADWLARLDTEADNLRAGIAFSQTQADLEPGLRLAASLGVYWRIRGHAAEGAEILRALLDMPAAGAATLPRARALAAVASLYQLAGDYQIADAYCQEALPIANAADDSQLAIELLSKRAWILMRQGRTADALTLIESGLRLARRLGDLNLIASLLSGRAGGAFAQGDPVDAARHASEAVRLFRQVGDQRLAGKLLGNLGYYELSAGQLEAGRRHLAEALGSARELNDRVNLTQQTFNLGLADYLGGSPEAATALFAESFGLARDTGSKADMAYALIGLALADQDATDPGRPARLHGAADQALADLGHAVEPLESRLAETDRKRLRAVLGDDAFEAEYAAGRALSPTDMLAALASADAAVTRTVGRSPGRTAQ